MNKRSANNQIKAFTLIELLVIILTIAMLVVLIFSGTARAKRESLRNQCINNLKQVGLAFRLWGNLCPMAVSTNNGGTLEFVGTGETFRHFQVVSNELMSLNVVTCPADVRRPPKSFVSDFSNANVSYFVGVDADENQPEMLLSGDRNVINGTAPTNGMLTLTTNNPARWTKAMHKREGNVGLADGHVQRVDIPGLQKLIEHTGVATNRISLP
ncbi:MAG: type II secretion system protein [Verrucomicrobia bacterium]|nr:type II secretion system protein [Verrucomicrobiota bacterium]